MGLFMSLVCGLFRMRCASRDKVVTCQLPNYMAHTSILINIVYNICCMNKNQHSLVFYTTSEGFKVQNITITSFTMMTRKGDVCRGHVFGTLDAKLLWGVRAPASNGYGLVFQGLRTFPKFQRHDRCHSLFACKTCMSTSLRKRLGMTF